MFKSLQEGSDAEVRLFSDEILQGMADATRGILEEAADANPLSREIFDSILKFKESAVPCSNITELAFLRARDQFANW